MVTGTATPVKKKLNKEDKMSKQEKIEEIHDKSLNGQKKDMVALIDEYGLYDFWSDYADYLHDMFINEADRYHWFRDAVVHYHRITLTGS